MKYLEAKGDSIDAAVESALQQLGMSRDDVSVEVIKQPKSGFLGFGKENHIGHIGHNLLSGCNLHKSTDYNIPMACKGFA